MSDSPQTLTQEECDKLLAAFDTTETLSSKGSKKLRNRLITLLLLDSGLRVGELVNLTSKDLYFNNEPVYILTVRKDISKSKSDRTIPLTDRVRATAKRFLESNQWLTRYVEPQFLFSASSGNEPMTTRQVERIITGAAMKWLGRPVHPHMLRHTCGTNLMRVTNARTVQELLGHKHLSSTQVYTHPNEEDKKSAIAQMRNGNAQG